MEFIALFSIQLSQAKAIVLHRTAVSRFQL